MRDDFRIETRGRETLAYWEGDRAFLFHAAWGVQPPVLYVPSERRWDEVVPTWLRGRRDVVVDRLARRSQHRIEETERGYAAGRGELRPLASAAEARAVATEFLARLDALLGPREVESFVETDRGWRLTYRVLDRERAPALPDGRASILVRRDTGEIEVERARG